MKDLKMPLSLDWLRPGVNRSTAFLTIKYILIASLVIMLLLSTIFFSAIVAFDVKIENSKHPQVAPETLRKVNICFLIITMVVCAAGLIGVIRESFGWTVVFASCMLFGTFGHKDEVYGFVISILLTGLSFVFSAMIRKANNGMIHSGPYNL